MQPSLECRKESVSRRLQGTANDSGQSTFPIVLRGAMMEHPEFPAARVRQSVPILRSRGTLDLLQWRNEQNCRLLKQK